LCWEVLDLPYADYPDITVPSGWTQRWEGAMEECLRGYYHANNDTLGANGYEKLY